MTPPTLQLSLAFLLALGLTLFSPAAPTTLRSWKSTAGTTLEAKAIGLENDMVTFEALDGRTAKVPLDRLVEADRELLENHFQPSEAAAVQLGHPLGKSSRPIDAGGSSYLLYLPKSMKAGKLYPLMFVTSPKGGNPGRFDALSEGAELCEWIVAQSVESKNGPAEDNLKHSQLCMEHIKKNLPVDTRRIYFSGSSGGARAAFANAAKMGAAGVFAMTAGAEPGELKKGCDYFFVTGGYDYNRAGVAISFNEVKSNAALRFHTGGHGVGPDWLATEAFIWLDSQARRKLSINDPAQQDYERRLLAWVEKLAVAEPHRATWWTTYFKKGKFSTANQPRLDALHTKLSSTLANTAYVQGLADLEAFAAKVLVNEPQYAPKCFNHTSPAVQKGADQLLETHSNTPAVKDLLQAIKKKTDKG